MNQSPASIVSRVWRRAGVRIIPNRRLDHFPAAAFLRRLFEFLDVDGVIDVGANTGQYHDFLRRQVGFKGQIVSFEPIPDHVETLRAMARSEPGWTIKGIALGSAPGVGTFNIMGTTQFSSFLSPDHSKVAMFEGSNRVRQRTEVEISTLDRELPALKSELGISRPYLKLDTQGFDLEVVKGAADTLSTMRAIQTEASVVPIYEGMPDYVTTMRTLESKGFVLSGIYPNNPAHFPRLIEFDCYMINQSFLPAVAR